MQEKRETPQDSVWVLHLRLSAAILMVCALHDEGKLTKNQALVLTRVLRDVQHLVDQERIF